MITTQKITTGYFNVLDNGLETKYMILNLDLGISGNTANSYGIQDKETKKITKVGSLAKAKKQAAYWIAQDSKKIDTLDLSDWEPVSEEEQNAMLKRETGIALKK